MFRLVLSILSIFLILFGGIGIVSARDTQKPEKMAATTPDDLVQKVLALSSEHPEWGPSDISKAIGNTNKDAVKRILKKHKTPETGGGEERPAASATADLDRSAGQSNKKKPARRTQSAAFVDSSYPGRGRTATFFGLVERPELNGLLALIMEPDDKTPTVERWAVFVPNTGEQLSVAVKNLQVHTASDGDRDGDRDGGGTETDKKNQDGDAIISSRPEQSADWLRRLVLADQHTGIIDECHLFRDRVEQNLNRTTAHRLFHNRDMGHDIGAFLREIVFSPSEAGHYIMPIALEAVGHHFVLEFWKSSSSGPEATGRIFQSWVKLTSAQGTKIGYSAREYVSGKSFGFLPKKQLESFFADLSELQEVLRTVVESDLRESAAAVLKTMDLEKQREWAGKLSDNIKKQPFTLQPGSPEQIDGYEQSMLAEG